MDNLEEKEREVLAISLATASEITALRLDEYIQTQLIQGVSRETLEANLLKDLNEGGRIFGEFRNTIKATAHGNMRKISDIGTYAYEGENEMMMWVTVGDTRVCPDCDPLMGVVKTMEAWEILGLPRTGWSICRSNCRCVLASTGGQKVERITRKRKKK